MSSTTRALRRHPQQRRSLLDRWGLWLAIGLPIAAVVLIVLLGIGKDGGGSSPVASMGNRAPDFSAKDVVSGKTVTLSDLKGSKTLLFFSEGAGCEACMMQIRDLEKRQTELRKRDIRLVSVTTDPPDVLASAAKQYGITTPLLSDESTQMSSQYEMLGRGGMGHPSADGHAFMLLNRAGRVRWEQEYAEMFVPARKLLNALPRK